jgi:hemoglobin
MIPLWERKMTTTAAWKVRPATTEPPGVVQQVAEGTVAQPVMEDAIAELVDAFYARIRRDPELGPIFERAIPGDWGPHLATMRAFWSSVMLASGRYKGNPLAVHLRIEGMAPELFARWLALFSATCHELFDAAVAEAFMVKAVRIAESFKLALFYRLDRPWPPQS